MIHYYGVRNRVERDELQETVASRIRQAMQEAQITGKELSHEINCTQSEMCKTYNGMSMPSLHMVYKIACRLGISIDWMCGISEV